MKKTIEEIFDEMKRTFAERNKAYGDSYRVTGNVLAAMFPRGLTLNTPDQWNRFGAFYMIICKMVRYSETMTTGGHIDSAHDSAVYSAILEQLTREYMDPPHATRIKPKFIILFKRNSFWKDNFVIVSATTEDTAITYIKKHFGDTIEQVIPEHMVSPSLLCGFKEIVLKQEETL
jgi:hypothetical protein